MSYTLTVESLDGVTSSWNELRHCLKWGSIFVLPAWLKVWWEVFGSGAELYLRTLRQREKIIGLAPLLVNKETASFIGSADVCDYLDFVIIPGREQDFFKVMLDDLREKGINQLDLRPLRPDSTVLSHLVSIAQNRGYEVLCHPEDVSLVLDLPSTWDEYLAILSKKQRHEVRRKLRRLWEAGNVEHRCVEVGREVEDYLDIFLKLFSLSRDEKASFMNPKMESFFRSLAKAMAEIGLLRLGIIQLDKVPVAMTMGFDYNDSHYLYNSAYDPQFNYLSVGLLCKVLCLKESIEKGRKKWDFLKGGEPYKYQLGGQEIPLYSCQIIIK
ncbi:MAG TPA: GNAT family N-acetyltransferase [Dehalococcoidia bacterium]|nr:GNAT family N-acetyltransferase [Dehalococcoidia bacterium]